MRKVSVYVLLLASVHAVGVVGTVIFESLFLLTTLLAVFSATSSAVTYLFEVDGVPLVPARASYLGLSVMRATGSQAGATSVLILPRTVVLAVGCVLPAATALQAPPIYWFNSPVVEL